MAILTKPPKGTERICLNCKHNCIKIIMAKFETGDPCTGICNNPGNGIYYNNVSFTCEDWEAREEDKNE
jgi:hypothetical protein